jgi:hypothetical protein
LNEEPEPAVVEEEAAEAAPAEEPFQFGTLTPEVSFALRQVQPPSECYISPDDHLLVEAWNVLAGVALVVNARILKPDGTLIQNTWSYIPTSAGALNAWQQGLAEGFLLTLSVDSGQAPAGACYVRVRLLRGAMPGLYPVSQTLVAGYVVRGSTLSWPYPRFVGPCEGPGRPRVIVGTDPFAGLEILEVVPAGVRWKLLAVKARLVTDATAGNRYVVLYLDDVAQVWWSSVPMVAQVAGSIYNYNWALGVDARTGPATGYVQDPLPDRITLAAGWRFGTTTIGKQVGDDWGAPVYYVEEWVEP